MTANGYIWKLFMSLKYLHFYFITEKYISHKYFTPKKNVNYKMQVSTQVIFSYNSNTKPLSSHNSIFIQLCLNLFRCDTMIWWSAKNLSNERNLESDLRSSEDLGYKSRLGLNANSTPFLVVKSKKESHFLNLASYGAEKRLFGQWKKLSTVKHQKWSNFYYELFLELNELFPNVYLFLVYFK